MENKLVQWIRNQKYVWKHNQRARQMNSDLEKIYYKSKSTDIIDILSELDKKAGLSSYDIVPFLKKIKRMPQKYVLIEKGSGGARTERHINDELFKELEQLEFIRIVENKLFSTLNGITFPTSLENCVLRVKLLPKGIDYLIEHQKRKKNNFYQIFTIWLLILASLLAFPQACNEFFESRKIDDNIIQQQNYSLADALLLEQSKELVVANHRELYNLLSEITEINLKEKKITSIEHEKIFNLYYEFEKFNLRMQDANRLQAGELINQQNAKFKEDNIFRVSGFKFQPVKVEDLNQLNDEIFKVYAVSKISRFYVHSAGYIFTTRKYGREKL
ncbi:hypothetical protein [Flavobacterium sp.]|jgi:hypothetical protein|uniref:hypothetical protein n=1 Tax=Flavobacterium sp. TaxID=239 RepID=UPI0037C09612